MEDDSILDYRADIIDMQMAGFGLRMVAMILDIFILFFAAIVFSRVLIPVINWGMEQVAFNSGQTGLIVGITIYFTVMPLIGILYHTTFECSKWQGTPGKIGLKLKVVTIEGTGISFLQAFGRTFSKFISAPLLFIGFLMVIWTDEQRALHDIIAKTYVIKQKNMV